MREKLLVAYQQRHADFKSVRTTFPDVDMSGPFLISPNEHYNNQPFPLLIIGQETKGWGDDVEDLNVQMNLYENFNLGEKYHSSPFWNITRKVEKALGNEPYTCTWTNISKYDVNCGRAYGLQAETIATLDDILLDEIKILKPKVCLFFTGVDFDDRIKKIFPGVEYLPVKEHSHPDRFFRLKHTLLPTLTFRSDHPKYLRLSGQEQSIIDYIKTLTK